MNRTILCNCIIEAENNFLLESIATCDPDSTDVDLEMYFMANTAFLNYFEGIIDTLEVPFLHNVTMQEHILPISLESDEFDKELLAAPVMLRELVEKNIKERNWILISSHEILEPEEDFEKETSIFDHFSIHYIYFCNGISFINNSYNSNNAII